MATINSVLYFVFRLLARWRQPALAAHLLRLTTRRLPVVTRTGRTEYRALVLSRVGFRQDIDASFREAETFELLTWPNYALKAFAAGILSPTLDHNNYLTSDPAAETSKLEYRAFLDGVWRTYSAGARIDVVLTGNFAYFTEREFAVVVEKAGTPFIALHKENVRPPERIKFWHAVYKQRRGKFGGRKIIVYNNVERDLQLSTEIAKAANVVVAGMPRLDRLHAWRRDHANGKSRDPNQVLFFAFARNEKLTAIQRKPAAAVPGNIEQTEGNWGKISWKQLGEQTHRAIIELARRRPDLNVILKTKGQQRKQKDILAMLEEIGGTLPANLAVVTGGDPFEMITNSRVVVGFNTTGLLEAIAAGKPVVVPRFAEAADAAMKDYIIDFGDSVIYAASPAELIDRVCELADAPPQPIRELSSTARRTLRYWAGNDDGAAGQRVLKTVLDEIRAARR